MDKPGKGRDIYHTAYALSGFSLSQELGTVVNESKLVSSHPIANVTMPMYEKAKAYFDTLQPL